MMNSGLIRSVSLLVRRAVSIAMVSAFLTFWAYSTTVSGADIYTGEQISLDLVDADLNQVLISFAEITGFIFVMDAQTAAEGGLERLITVGLEEVRWDDALDRILADAGLEWTLEGNVLWIHFPAYAPAGDRKFTGDAIRLRLEEADLRQVLATMGRVTELAIDIDPDVEGTISVNLKDIPWDQTLDLILRISGLDYAQEGDGIRVFKAGDSTGMQLMRPSEI